MRKIKTIIAAFVLAIIVAIPAAVVQANPEEQGYIPVRTFFEETIGATVEWIHDAHAILIDIEGVAVVLLPGQSTAIVGDNEISLPDGVFILEGKSFISEGDLEAIGNAVQAAAIEAMLADEDAIIVIITGRYGQGTPESNEMVRSILGGDNTQERFNVYFNWYNTVHEIAHLVEFVLREEPAGLLESEMFANSFALAFWSHFGDEDTFDILRELVPYAVGNFDRPIAADQDFYDFERLFAAGEIQFTFNDYGWFQFSLVNYLLDDMRDLEAVMGGSGFTFSEPLPQTTISFSSIGEEAVHEIIRAVLTVLYDWGIEMPLPIYHVLDDDPNNHAAALGVTLEMLEHFGFSGDRAVRIWPIDGN